MSVRESTTYKELMELMQTPGRRVHWRLEGNLMVNGQAVKYTNIVDFSSKHLFGQRYYGDLMLTLRIGLAGWRHLVKNKRQIQFELVRAHQSADGVATRGGDRLVQTFNAHLTDATDPVLDGQVDGQTRTDGTVADLSQLKEVTLQLVEPLVDTLRMEEVGGIYRNATVGEVLQTLLGFQLPEKNAPVETLLGKEYEGLRGVDLQPPDNAKRYDHIIVPNGMRLYQLPKYLQENYGVYASGLGWHIFRGWCYLYPLLNYRKFTERQRTLTVLNVPESEVPVMERTFLNRSGQLYVFATGKTEMTDNTEQVQLNRGNGLRMSKASDLIDGMSKTSQNKTHFSQQSQVTGVVVDERPDKVTNVRQVPGHYTDNPYAQTSELAASLGTIVAVNWDRAAPELLYPGMPTKFLYKAGNRIHALMGTLVGISIYTATHSGSATDTHFLTKCKLVMNLERIPDA